MTTPTHPAAAPRTDDAPHVDAPANAPENPEIPVIEELDDLLSLGRMWARYGLQAGSRALQASARTLAVTSSLLNRLGEEIHPEADGAA